MDALCSCFESAYLCYSDCDKLPEDFETKCLRTCDPEICRPTLSIYAKSSAASAGVHAAAVAAAGAAVAAAAAGAVIGG